MTSYTSGTGAYERCNFQLTRPSNGMSGGGAGRCRLSDGQTIDARFPVA